MKKVVLLSKLYTPGRKLLENKVTIIEHYCNNILDAEEDIQDADCILIGNQHFDSSSFALCKNLQVLAKQGSGTDNIDLISATTRKIPVVISPGANAKSVAEHVIMLILASCRNLIKYDRATRNGDYEIRTNCGEYCIYGKKIGIIGYGKIGKEVCNYSRAFGMKVLIFDPFLCNVPSYETGVDFCNDISEIFKTCDIVSLHVPLTPETRGMIGSRQISMMKTGSVLINCSRGGIIDEEALYQALYNGHLHGAGLDVFTQEPPTAANPLFSLDNVVVTPHSAALTEESAFNMSTITAKGIIAVLSKQKWEHVANPKVFDMD